MARQLRLPLGDKRRSPSSSAATPAFPPVPAEYLPKGRRRIGANYMRGEASPFFHSWRPALREVSDDVRNAYTWAAARAIDSLQNSGWLAGGVEQAIASTIGTGLRLASKPDNESLGWTLDEAQIWSQNVERRFELWANRPIECDIEGKATLGRLNAQALRSYYAYGEIISALPYKIREGGMYGTKLQMLPPHRLIQRTESPNLYQGVRRDLTGYPVGYIIGSPADGFTPYYEREIPARDPYGRPQFIHVFDGFVGQVRGISPMVPALRVVRQYDQLADATLTQALIQAIFAATVKSPSPTEDVLSAFQDLTEQADSGSPSSPLEAMLEASSGWYDQTQIDLGSHGKIAHLAPGDELEFHSNKTPNDNYDPFTKALLREIARALGVTFEMLTGDYSGATYSSVRMATSEIWQIVLYRRIHLCSPFLQSAYESWLEEEIERGLTPFPGGIIGFLENRAAAARAHWRGPAKPQADDLKFARAIESLRNLGIVTDEWICSELGDDWQDTYEQRKREQDARDKLGLRDPNPKVQGAGRPAGEAENLDETTASG